jgi:hypothetical protein
VKFENLYQDPESEAPYAESLLIDSGGMTLKVWDEPVHVSFEGLDPFEVAFHAMPVDWERHEEWDHLNDTYNQLSVEQHCENGIYAMLEELGRIKGWERK